MARILLTGASGQVGGDLLPLLQQFGEVIAPTREDLDLSNASAIRAFVREVSPRWIINPAAYTAVDRAESEPELAARINTEAPKVLGYEAKRLGSAVVHFSTDYVFDGTGTKPWLESDPTGPLGVYGKTKLAGEQALAGSGAAHVVFRTSWVYAIHGKNFLRTILRFAREKTQMNIVADQHGAPTWSRNLAALTAHLIGQTERLAASQHLSIADALQPASGIYHAADAGETTWFGFAQFFLQLAAEHEPGQEFAHLSPITTAEYPTPARRPANSRLNCDRLAQVLGFEMPSWQNSTRKVMAELLAHQ